MASLGACMAPSLPTRPGQFLARSNLGGLGVKTSHSPSLHRRKNLRRRVTECQAGDWTEDKTASPSRAVSGSFFAKRATLVPSTSKNLTSSTSSSTDEPSSSASIILENLGKYLKPALVGLAIAALLWYTPGDALAANSGGRAGGRSFSASRARSYSAPSQSYSRGGFSGPSYVAPSPGFSAPFFAPSPFFSPFPFFGPTLVVGGGGGGGGIFSFIMFSVVAYFVVSAVLSFFQPSEEDVWQDSQQSSVVRLQVGLMGSARQLQKDLERMALRADTNTPEGLHYVLQEAVLSLLRNPDYCIYGYSTSEVTKDSYDGEQAFNRLSMEERSKFKAETLVNVGDVRKHLDRAAVGSSGFGSEYIVVTILAATEGKFTIPEIRSAADLRQALTQLGSITVDDLQAVEILWTPENEEDTLTTKDMVHDYPLLRPL